MFDDDDDDDAPPEFETVATFGSVVEAELMLATLQVHRITARLRDAHTAAVDPAIIAAIGFVKLDVMRADLALARELLASLPDEAPDDVDEAARCPSCDSPYLDVERDRRLHCRRCERTCSRAAARRHARGPRPGAGQAPGDSPVFRLRCDHRGMGLFAGAASALFTAIVLRGVDAPAVATVVAVVGGPALGWLVGRLWGYLACSDPACRARLGPRAAGERCHGCGKAFAGSIARSADHYSARAAWLRGHARTPDT